jgi:hypothetical protein
MTGGGGLEDEFAECCGRGLGGGEAEVAQVRAAALGGAGGGRRGQPPSGGVHVRAVGGELVEQGGEGSGTGAGGSPKQSRVWASSMGEAG